MSKGFVPSPTVLDRDGGKSASPERSDQTLIRLSCPAANTKSSEGSMASA